MFWSCVFDHCGNCSFTFFSSFPSPPFLFLLPSSLPSSLPPSQLNLQGPSTHPPEVRIPYRGSEYTATGLNDGVYTVQVIPVNHMFVGRPPSNRTVFRIGTSTHPPIYYSILLYTVNTPTSILLCILSTHTVNTPTSILLYTAVYLSLIRWCYIYGI